MEVALISGVNLRLLLPIALLAPVLIKFVTHVWLEHSTDMPTTVSASFNTLLYTSEAWALRI